MQLPLQLSLWLSLQFLLCVCWYRCFTPVPSRYVQQARSIFCREALAWK
jgi:hypothetical protein